MEEINISVTPRNCAGRIRALKKQKIHFDSYTCSVCQFSLCETCPK
jgi:hypothetical protein